MFGLLIALLVLALIVWLAFYVIDLIPLPDPPKMIIKVIVGLIVLIYLLGLLFGAMPMPAHWSTLR